MGQISSGVGLISGLPIDDIVSQLIAIEARPKQLVEQRIAILQSQQIAFQNVNAKLLSLKLSAGGFVSNRTFDNTAATSSDESILGATSSSTATPGTYSFIVDRLVTTQQFITTGVADQDTTLVGVGTLTFEFGDARLDTDTKLSTLNGGNGITRGKINIQDRSGMSAEVDLSKAMNDSDVLNTINSTAAIKVTASISGDKFVLTDTSGSTTTSLTVTDVNSSGTTASLGLDAAAVGNTLTGNQVNLLTTSSAMTLLNDGNAVRTKTALNDLRITQRNGGTFDVDLSSATTINDVISAINTASGGNVMANIDTSSVGLRLVDSTVGVTTFAVTALNSSNAATDLGILLSDGDSDGIIVGDRVLAELDSKLVKNLNGGTGATLGQVSITDRSGSSDTVDLTGAGSISKVIDLLNAASINVVASLNQAGNGLLLTDKTGSTTSDLIVTDVTGTGAVDLNLAGSFTADEADSGNLQIRYLSEQTALGSLNGGLGVARGKFEITDSGGTSATVDLNQGNEVTVQDVIDEINSRGLLINARINNNGDGLLIEDTGPGSVKLKVEEDGSTTAADLGILGEVTNFGDDLDATAEKTVTVGAMDTLEDVVTTINNAGYNVRATVINDGSPLAPFRLNLTASRGGQAGAFVFDDGALTLSTTTLTQAKDALVFFGSGDPAQAIAIRATSNTLNTVISGATIDLKRTDADAVQVTITRDDSAITSAVQDFVDDFNQVMDTLNTYDTFNSETEERGLLLGDTTVGIVRNSLFRLATGTNGDLIGQFTNLTQIGIRVGTGARLEFNQTRFLEALESDPSAVEDVFTFKQTTSDPTTNKITLAKSGILVRFEELLNTLTDSVDGRLQLRLDAMQDQIDLGNKRIEQIDDSLVAKRARLKAEFFAMERVLVQLQGQSSSLLSLRALASSISTRRSS